MVSLSRLRRLSARHASKSSGSIGLSVTLLP